MPDACRIDGGVSSIGDARIDVYPSPGQEIPLDRPLNRIAIAYRHDRRSMRLEIVTSSTEASSQRS